MRCAAGAASSSRSAWWTSNVREWTAFDADTGKDMGREVREYFVPDFSAWKDHDAYRKAFDRLLRDLKAGELRTLSGAI